LVCECRRVCRNCSLLWLQILSLNVSRHSAISISKAAISPSLLRRSAQAWPNILIYVRFVWYGMNAKSWTAWCIFRTRTEQYMRSENVFKVWKIWGLEHRLYTCGIRVHVFRQGHIGKFIEYFSQCRTFADNMYVISHNYGGYAKQF